ncbi:MAG: zinc ribbon domain-containing protein [Eubacteriales bacterium]
MDEQRLEQKQRDMIKSVYGFSKAAYIILIILVCCIALYCVAKPGFGSLSGLLGYFTFVLSFYFILYFRRVDRSKTIAMVIFVSIVSRDILSLFVETGIYHSDAARIIKMITGLIFLVIEIYFAWLLLRKSYRKKYVERLIKPFWFVFLASLAARYYALPFLDDNGNRLAAVIIIAACVSLIYFLSLFIIYKGLTDTIFYKSFFEVWPVASWKRWSHDKSRVLPMYCSKCGAALVPGANFCRQCGHSVILQAAKPLNGGSEE